MIVIGVVKFVRGDWPYGAGTRKQLSVCLVAFMHHTYRHLDGVDFVVDSEKKSDDVFSPGSGCDWRRRGDPYNNRIFSLSSIAHTSQTIFSCAAIFWKIHFYLTEKTFSDLSIQSCSHVVSCDRPLHSRTPGY